MAKSSGFGLKILGVAALATGAVVAYNSLQNINVVTLPKGINVALAAGAIGAGVLLVLKN